MLKQQACISASVGDILMPIVTDEGFVYVCVCVSVNHEGDDVGRPGGR